MSLPSQQFLLMKYKVLFYSFYFLLAIMPFADCVFGW